MNQTPFSALPVVDAIDAHARFGLFPSRRKFSFRLGQRAVTVCRDFRKRFYCVNPLLDCGAGEEAGYLEILVLKRWLVVLGKAH